MRSLQVSIDQRSVGTLLEGNDLWAFEYDRQWASAADGYDLSPALPRQQVRIEDGGTNRPVQWYFDNLLPEERLRETIAREAGLKGGPEDAFALLEWLGAESAGSLTLLPAGAAFPGTGELKPLSDEELSRRIAALPRATLASGAPKRMSLAGAQHKLLVNYKDGQLFEPVGATASTHILKPNHPEPDTYPASAFNEYLTMRLADSAGLRIPRVDLRYVPDPVYIIERFDRRQVDGLPPQRTHIVDACQLLNKARSFKHTGATLESLNDIVERCTNRAVTRLQLYKWLVFNILIGNDDCHLKNLSFHVNSEGVTLAPHYDLLSTAAYWTRAIAGDYARWPDVPMAFELPGARAFGEVTRQSVLAAAAVIRIPERVARRVLDDLLRDLNAGLPRIAEELGRRRQAAPEEAKVHFAMQQRLFDVLRNMIYSDMTRALTA